MLNPINPSQTLSYLTTLLHFMLFISPSFVEHTRGWLCHSERLPPPLLPSPSLHASLRKAHLLHALDPHFAETLATVSQYFRYCFLKSSFKSHFSTLFSPLLFLLVPLSGRLSIPRYSAQLFIFCQLLEKPHYIFKPFPTLIKHLF